MKGPDTFVIDRTSGREGSIEEWIERFTKAWARGAAELEAILGLLSPDVRLIAPGLRETVGAAQARVAFERTFAALPDLTATVDSWAFRHNHLFIEMRFRATVGAEIVEWPNVDRFRFAGGRACERVAFFNPAPVRRAYLGHWRGWQQLWKIRRAR